MDGDYKEVSHYGFKFKILIAIVSLLTIVVIVVLLFNFTSVEKLYSNESSLNSGSDFVEDNSSLGININSLNNTGGPSVSLNSSVTLSGGGGGGGSGSSGNDNSNDVIDNYPPSAPQNLVSTSVGVDSVGLAWDSSTDDLGVSGYMVIRDGINVANVSS